MAALVFCLACGIVLAPTYHMGVLGFHASLIYLMNAATLGRLFVILSIYKKAHSIRSSSMLHLFSIRHIPKHLDCGPFRHHTNFPHGVLYPSLMDMPHAQKILESGHTKLQRKGGINEGNFSHWGDKEQHGKVKSMVKVISQTQLHDGG